MSSANSIISDPEPYKVPEKVTVKVETTGWEKLANSRNYKDINAYLEGRKEYFRRYLPGGTPIEQLDEAGRNLAWGQALCVINEIEGIQASIALSKKR